MNKVVYYNFLSYDEIYGERQLEIFKKIGPKAVMTDYATFMSKYLGKQTVVDGVFGIDGYWINDSNLDKNSITSRYISSGGECKSIKYELFYNGQNAEIEPFICNTEVGVRLVANFDDISEEAVDIGINSDGIREVLYGVCPQNMVDNQNLFQLYNEKIVKCKNAKWIPHVGSIASLSPVYETENSTFFVKFNSYQYLIKSRHNEDLVMNSTFFDVQPIVWLLDEKTKKVISKDILFSCPMYSSKFGSFSLKNNNESQALDWINAQLHMLNRDDIFQKIVEKQKDLSGDFGLK